MCTSVQLYDVPFAMSNCSIPPPSVPLSLDLLMSGGELAGVQLLEEDRPWLNRARREVEAQAKRMLLQGLELMVNH